MKKFIYLAVNPETKKFYVQAHKAFNGEKGEATPLFSDEVETLRASFPDVKIKTVCLADRLVTAIEIKPDIKKGFDIRGACFYQIAILTLEDGNRTFYQVSTQRKKDLPKTCERKISTVAAKAMTLSSTGCFVEQFIFGGAGLVAAPH